MPPRTKLTLSWPVLLLVTVVVNGVFYGQHALWPKRIAPERTGEPLSQYRVEATLWEDPLEAAWDRHNPLRGQAANGQTTQAEEAHEEQTPDEEVASQQQVPDPCWEGLPGKIGCDKNTHVLLVMIPSEAKAWAHEARIRTRYAVMSALRSHSYAPDDKNSVKRFLSKKYLGPNSKQGSTASCPLALFTVYESFSCPVSSNSGGKEGCKPTEEKKRRVFVFWLPDSVFASDPREDLNRLVKHLRNGDNEGPRISLIGPIWSGTLDKMLNQADRQDPKLKLNNVNVYSATATAPFVKECEVELRNLFGHFERVIGSDARLCTELVHELKRRGIDPANDAKDHVLLVSDWGSYFTRELPATFRKELDERRKRNDDKDRLSTLHVFTFARGIDGALGDQQDKSRANDNSDVASSIPPPYSPPAVGENRLDYLRRFAGVLREDVSVNAGHIRAVGVFADDAYDRLQIMHLLKSVFPDSLFFTNDLDVRFAAKENLPFTRNLIVASHFGLRLAREYQANETGHWVPPFRDTYQTSRYLACCLALKNQDRLTPKEKEGIDSPRLFEIGNGGIIDLSVEPQDLHPQRRSTLIRGNAVEVPVLAIATALQYGLIVCLAMLLLASVSKTVADRFRETRRARILDCTFWVLTAWGILLALIIGYDHFLNPEGEFWSITTGTSIWSSVVLQYIAVAVTICFIVRGDRTIAEDKRTAKEVFGLSHDTPKREPKLGMLQRTWRYCSFDGLRRSFGEAEDEQADEVSVSKLWGAFSEQRTWQRTLLRVGFHAVILIVFFMALLGVRQPLAGAYRGYPSYVCSLIGEYSSLLALVVLTFLVVDVSLLSSKFVRKLAQRRSVWPQATLDHFREQRDCDDCVLGEWLDIQLIAQHSERIERLVYGPFVVLALLFMGRLRYIDNFPWPVPLIAFLAILFIYMFGCTVLLRSVAEKGRRRVIQRLNDHLVSARDPDNIRKTQLTLDEIRAEARGAFSPFSENPIVRALLIPSGGASLLALIELLT